MRDSAYARSGVDINAGNRAVELMSEAVRSTYGPEVLLGIGAFGGLFDATKLQGMDHPVLVASTDGVGTKTVISGAIGQYESLGRDIVNHCINDILVQGAEPLFFLDYIAAPKLALQTIADVVAGVAAACREAGCALLGGETAEMPGVYAPGQMDIAGTIVGVVEREAIIDGTRITPGDRLIGLPSDGLHTNGYSLVRSLFGPETYNKHADLLGMTLAEALAVPHRSYLSAVRAIRQVADIKGLVHLTGGSFIDNIPRILPSGVGAIVNCSAWEVPFLFQLIQSKGDIAEEEMFRVFNMGIGMIVIVSPEEVEAVQQAVTEPAPLIGEIVAATGEKDVTLA